MYLHKFSLATYAPFQEPITALAPLLYGTDPQIRVERVRGTFPRIPSALSHTQANSPLFYELHRGQKQYDHHIMPNVFFKQNKMTCDWLIRLKYEKAIVLTVEITEYYLYKNHLSSVGYHVLI